MVGAIKSSSDGASPTTGMTHIAIQGALEGKYVEWLEKVSDEEYIEGC